jgi:hypothetical protein
VKETATPEQTVQLLDVASLLAQGDIEQAYKTLEKAQVMVDHDPNVIEAMEYLLRAHRALTQRGVS